VDDGFVEITNASDADRFVTLCRGLRYWDREPLTHMVHSL
jgi:hypothetical protein